MDHSVKVWLIRLLVCLPVLCLVISVALWKHTQNESYNIETAKRQLQVDSEARSVKLRDELEQINIAKRELKKDVEAETAKVRGELDNMQHEKRQLRLEVENAQSEKKLLRGDLEHLQETKREISTQLEADKLELNEQLKKATELTSGSNRDKRDAPGVGGAVYVIWGRTSCPSTTNTELVYAGIAGGGHYTHTGAAVNLLCLVEHPHWGAPAHAAGTFALIYGAEYEVNPADFLFGHDNAPALHDHNVPCAVCRARTRSSAIMIPGRSNCTGTGWQLEYNGWLMAGHYSHKAATEYNCVDANPEAEAAGVKNENGRLLYRVKGRCGSLPCPDYENDREITCAVCTK